MDKLSIFLSVVLTLAMIMLIAPNVLARNRGKTLRNIAVWLALFTGLALVYRLFGPDSEHPMFMGPAVVMHRHSDDPDDSASPPAKPADDKSDGSHGYTPPSE